jgi:hypothetical protein
MSKAPEQRKVVRADEFKPPKKIAREDFDSLCDTFSIPQSHRQTVKDDFDKIVEIFADLMEKHGRQAHRSSDRECLNEALSQLAKVADRIQRLGPSGRWALKSASRLLAPMLAAKWMHERFWDDDYAPHASTLPDQSGRFPRVRRGPEYFIEEFSLDARLQFVRRNTVEVAGAALRTIEQGLRSSLEAIDRQPGSKGGRRPLSYRHDMIISLASIWDFLGRPVSTGPKSDFAAFCESVVVSIGWPGDGMSSAVADAVRDWRNRTGKSRR